MMKKPRSHSDNAARESYILDRSDREGTPGWQANSLNTIIMLLRVLLNVPRSERVSLVSKLPSSGVEAPKPSS